MDLSSVHHRFLNPHHRQEVDSETLDSIIASSTQQAAAAAAQEKDPSSNPNSKPRPADNEAQKCPRCDSTNTKFCYYNNYSLSQPRYFCKSCRRYWTKGGTLRNVPVGGGCRKSAKRPSSPSSLLIKRPHTYETTTASNPASLFYAGGGGFDHPLHHLQGNGNNAADCDGNLLPNPHAFAFLDSLRHNTGLFHSLGYGAGGDEGLARNMPFADVAGGGIGNAVTSTAAMKQEGGGSDGRALWGYPWQVMNYGDQIGAASDVESIRGSWNGLIRNSAWQGLVNSPALI